MCRRRAESAIPGGSSPTAFHTRVLPRLSSTRACRHRAARNASYSGRSLSGGGYDICVVKEREDGLSVTQLGLDLAEGGLLCQGVKCWHERVLLFPTLAFSPCIGAGRAVKLPGEGHEWSQVKVTEQGTEHGLPGDVVERTDGVDGQHGCTRINLSGGSQHPGKGFGASSRAQAKLVRETSTFKLWRKRLGQRAADQAPKHIADDEGADAASVVGFCSAVIRPTRKGQVKASC